MSKLGRFSRSALCRAVADFGALAREWRLIASPRLVVLIFAYWIVCDALAADWMLSAPASIRRISPEPNAAISHTPLTFFWPAADSATGYSLVITGPAGSIAIRTAANYHVSSVDLPPGRYTWRITAHVPGRELVGSDRSFDLSASEHRLGDVDADRVAQRLASAQRPRFFPKGSEWGTITAALAGPRAQILESLDKRGRARGKVALGQTSPIPSVERARVKRELFGLSLELEDAALMWRLKKDEKWRARAQDLLGAIQSLDGPMIYAEIYDLLPARYMLWARIIAYDWMHDAFDEPARAELRSGIERGTRWLAEEILHPKRGLLRNPYDSHRSEVIGAAVCGAAVLLGETHSASQDFKDLFPLWLSSMLPTLASDGATAGSGAYALWDLASYTVPHADALRWAAGIDVMASTKIRRMSEWLVRAAPPRAPAIWWGDAAETIRRPEWEWAAQLLATRTDNEGIAWYVQRVGAVRFATAWHALAPVRSTASTVMPPAKRKSFTVFPLAGLGILNMDLSDPDALSLHFKSAPLGATGHSHFDQNGFVIAHKGRMLAIDSGSYDSWGSDHYKRWYRRTVAHNAITRDGGKGQEADVVSGAENRQGTGRIVRADNVAGVPYIVGDAATAYHPELRVATRIVAVPSPNVIAIFDDIESSSAHQWEWNLHAIGARRSGPQTIEINNGPARACVDLYSATPGAIAIGRRTGPKVTREWGAESHDHAVFALESPQTGAKFLALIILDCEKVDATVRIDQDAVELALPQQKLSFSRAGVNIQGVR